MEGGAACPCGMGRRYAECCGRFHHVAVPQRADELMRSRYSAYALGIEQYVLDTWHPSTRPASLDLAADQQGMKWIDLDVKRHEQIDENHAIVGFVARYKVGGRAHRMHETSRFVREDGRWFYVGPDEALTK